MKTLSWVVVALWMAVIFLLSAQPAVESDALSKSAAKVIISGAEQVQLVAEGTSSDMTILKKFNNTLRKYTHGVLYLILGILVLHAFRRSGFSGYLSIVFSFAFCIVYAVSDELHQIFVPGRGAQVSDFFMDSAGVAIGIALFGVVKYYRHRRLLG